MPGINIKKIRVPYMVPAGSSVSRISMNPRGYHEIPNAMLPLLLDRIAECAIGHPGHFTKSSILYSDTDVSRATQALIFSDCYCQYGCAGANSKGRIAMSAR